MLSAINMELSVGVTVAAAVIFVVLLLASAFYLLFRRDCMRRRPRRDAMASLNPVQNGGSIEHAGAPVLPSLDSACDSAGPVPPLLEAMTEQVSSAQPRSPLPGPMDAAVAGSPSSLPPALPSAQSLAPRIPESSIASGTGSPSTVDALRYTRTLHSHQSWSSFNHDALPRLLFYGERKFCRFSEDQLRNADEWFVIGDIHGDFYALHTIVSFILRTCPGFGIVFLGDLIDRGPHPIECLWYLLKLADDHPGRVLWLAGNHDVGVRYSDLTGTFRSAVDPAEFIEDLNGVDSFAPLRRAFGLEYIQLSEGLPRAAVMPDGLLLTHGGFPHVDLQAGFGALKHNDSPSASLEKWLESEPVLKDFTNLRITKYRHKTPNRLSTTCSYGYSDFAAFAQLMNGIGVKRLVTGHQHPITGYDNHPHWASNGHDALTLIGFGFADAYERHESYGVNYRRTLYVGHCRRNDIPEVLSIPVDVPDLLAFCEAEIKTMRRFAIS